MKALGPRSEPVVRPPSAQVLRAKRVGLVSLMILATVNIWTGAPLLALWVGSRVQSDGPPSMSAVAVAAVTLGVVAYCLVRLLARLDALYERAGGRQAAVKRHVPWLRSMRGERPHQQKHLWEISALEIVLIVTVVLVVVLFEVWFFFYSPSPIDGRSGRDRQAPLIGRVVPPPATGVPVSLAPTSAE